MKRSVQAFGVPLILAVGLLHGDGPLAVAVSAVPVDGQRTALNLQSETPGQTPPLSVVVPVKPGDKALRTYQLLPSSPPLSGPGDKIPHSYTVYGLRTGPGGMAFTDQNGVALPVPSQPRIITGPFNGMPRQPLLEVPPSVNVPPGVQVQPYYAPLPIPKK